MASWGLWESTYFPSLDWPGFHHFFSPEAATERRISLDQAVKIFPPRWWWLWDLRQCVSLTSAARLETNGTTWAGSELPRISPEMPQGAVDFFGSEVTMINIYFRFPITRCLKRLQILLFWFFTQAHSTLTRKQIQFHKTCKASMLLCEISKTRARMANAWKQKNFSPYGSFVKLQKHKPKRLILKFKIPNSGFIFNSLPCNYLNELISWFRSRCLAKLTK